MKNLNQYVGEKVKGVEFESRRYRDIAFAPSMKNFIGVEGTITEYCTDRKTFKVEFNSPYRDFWFYPAEVILPQLERELIGYTINDDEKYIKIIAGLLNYSVEDLLRLTPEGVHFSHGTHVEAVIKKYDLLDKCTPVYKQAEIALPKINGYNGEDKGDYIQYGCAGLLKAWFDSSNNRSIVSMTLDSGVVINKEQINQIQEYLLSKKSRYRSWHFKNKFLSLETI